MALATYPPGSDEQPSNAGIFGFAAHKVYLRRASPRGGVSSYLTFSPLPLRAVVFCGTRCRCLQRLPVKKYGALRCPDFPHADLRQPATIAFQGAKIQKILISHDKNVRANHYSPLPLNLECLSRLRNHYILESVVFFEIFSVFLLHLLLTVDNKHLLQLIRILTFQIFRHLTVVAVSAE